MAFERTSGAVLCLVTDRRRLAAALGRRDDEMSCLVRQVADAAAAGVDLVHLRERDLEARALLQLAVACVRAVEGSPTRVVVNDRLDVALAAGASGVHLRGDSVASHSIRVAAPGGFLIGRSVHGVAEASAEAKRGVVDYLVFGTMFPTSSKPEGRGLAGLSDLASVVRTVNVPVLGIGGIADDTLPALAASGAAGFAAIGWFVDAFRSGVPGDDLAARVARARRLFDTRGSIP